MKSNFDIAVFPGDGVGVEVMDAVLQVLDAVQSPETFTLKFEHFPGGAAAYRDTGVALSDEALKGAGEADAILFGAMGLPDIRYEDGTEIAPQLDLRFMFNLYAGVRPLKVIPGGPLPLRDPRAEKIDFVLIRESTEGLFVSRGKGVVEDDQRAIDKLVITREVSERLFHFSFKLAQKRKANGSPGKVTLVDKANIFASFAFFRKIFDEVAEHYPDIQANHRYVDATALDLVQRPWDYDVLVTENMFGDILSDLGAALIGGMGMAPSADIGDENAVFQPCHGSAPDIMGKGIANPVAMIRSAAMMLDWLAESYTSDACFEAAKKIEKAVSGAIGVDKVASADLGGSHTTKEITDAVLKRLDQQC